MQSIWHEILTYLMPDLPCALYRKCQLTAQNHFRKHNFRNDHVVTKITKIFYYKNLELHGISLRMPLYFATETAKCSQIRAVCYPLQSEVCTHTIKPFPINHILHDGC